MQMPSYTAVCPSDGSDSMISPNSSTGRGALVRNEKPEIFNSTGKLPAVYCTHGLTGSATFARRLARYLGPEQPIIGFQARHPNDGLDPKISIFGMAAEYLDTLRCHQPRGPYRLIGWCVGSLIAFEMAQQLLAEGEKITRLIVVEPPVRPVEADQVIRRPGSTTVSAALPEAVIRITDSIRRAALAYQLYPYPGELALLGSEENWDRVTAETSPWRRAVLGRLIAAKIAPTHRSMVLDSMPRVGFHVRRLFDAA